MPAIAQLVLEREIDARRLRAVAQRGVEEIEAFAGHRQQPVPAQRQPDREDASTMILQRDVAQASASGNGRLSCQDFLSSGGRHRFTSQLVVPSLLSLISDAHRRELIADAVALRPVLRLAGVEAGGDELVDMRSTIEMLASRSPDDCDDRSSDASSTNSRHAANCSICQNSSAGSVCKFDRVSLCERSAMASGVFRSS